MKNMTMTTPSSEWKKTACILCSVNCGLEVQTGGEDGRRIIKIRGDDAHPVSRGYLCEKSQRMDHYQNGHDRLTSPMRRRPDGSYEAISWDTAISEIALKFKQVLAAHGGESIFYYGGGGQGNHLGGAYAESFLKALGVKYRSNALAQEKLGEFWVQGKMFGAHTHADFEHCELALIIGKNPWQSHGFARARVVLREIQNDPKRVMVVIDPRRSETAAMADYHLAVRPGTDAWCLAAMAAIIVQEGLVARSWVDEHTTGIGELQPHLAAIDVARFAQVCGVDEALLREVARCIAKARSVAAMEDLGLQMNQHSTLGSYLQRMLWVLTGHYGRQGTSHSPVPFLSLAKASKGDTSIGNKHGERRKASDKLSPVAGAKIIIGLVPCNVISEEILTDHPKRYRAMLIQSGNPVHSLADSQRMREAMRALELSVVVDVAMTETAREADYVLPAASQFEKPEATFFNLEFPKNAFHLRQPLFAPLPGTLPEAEIYARLTEAMGELSERDYAPLRRALKLGRTAFSLAFFLSVLRKPKTMKYVSVLLYRTLGERLPGGLATAAPIWGIAQLFLQHNRKAAAKAGFGGVSMLAGNRLFEALLKSPSGLVYADGDHDDSWAAITHKDQRINLVIPELLQELAKLTTASPAHDPDYPFILAAGERRSDTSNTAVRDTSWHKKGAYGSLRISPQDAQVLNVRNGDMVRLRTRRASLQAQVEVTAIMQPGHISLPNGQGLDCLDATGRIVRKGVPPNELTDRARRDFLAGTPWHKYVPAQLERVQPELAA